MRSKDVQLGKVYGVKVSGNIAPVRLTGESQYGGYDGRNLKTNREIRIRTAARLRYEMVEVDGKWVAQTIVQVARYMKYARANIGKTVGELVGDVEAAMNNINDGGPNNPAQFSNDNA